MTENDRIDLRTVIYLGLGYDGLAERFVVGLPFDEGLAGRRCD
jgi:hypothetical protein